MSDGAGDDQGRCQVALRRGEGGDHRVALVVLVGARLRGARRAGPGVVDHRGEHDDLGLAVGTQVGGHCCFGRS